MSSLKSMLHKFMDEYASELSAARATEDFKRPFGRLVRQDIATYLQEKLDASVYYVKGSVSTFSKRVCTREPNFLDLYSYTYFT